MPAGPSDTGSGSELRPDPWVNWGVGVCGVGGGEVRQTAITSIHMCVNKFGLGNQVQSDPVR